MAEEIKKSIKKFTIIAAVYLFASAYFMYLGLNSCQSAGYAVFFREPQFEGIREAVSYLSGRCAFDIACFTLVAVTPRPFVCIFATTAVLALRSCAVGAAVAFLSANCVAASSVASVIAFSAVSILVMLFSFCLMLRENNTLVRVVIYLLVTGGAVLLRSIPLALL